MPTTRSRTKESRTELDHDPGREGLGVGYAGGFGTGGSGGNSNNQGGGGGGGGGYYGGGGGATGGSCDGGGGGGGAQGPAGKVELVTCKTVLRKVKGHRRKVRECKAKLVSGTVKFTTTRTRVRATISRRGVTFATGVSVQQAGGGSLLVLNARRRLTRGTYTLTLRTQREHGWSTRRTRITVD